MFSLCFPMFAFHGVGFPDGFLAWCDYKVRRDFETQSLNPTWEKLKLHYGRTKVYDETSVPHTE